MALGTNHVTNTTAATFIPELWSDEIVAAYKSNLVLANLVNRMPMSGKKGDTLHIPKPTRGSASAKAAETQVTLQQATETEVQVLINKHYEYSRLIEDITDVQALSSMRKFYTDDAGYALAKQVDDDLFLLGKKFGDDNGSGSDWIHSNSFYVDAANGIAAYAEDTVAATDVFTDLAFRELIKQLDDNDTPMDGRFIVVPPSVRQTIMGIDRYQSSDFVDGRGVMNGQIGSLYGVDVYVSSNCPVIEAAAANSASAVDTKAAIIGHKDAMVLAEQMGVRSQTQYKQEYLSNLFTSDTLYGTQVLRPESGLVVAVPA
jgi:N4-gp56 family major capsid protein|tara:strand:- start:1014 stop:1961 length:948 start_codon:yes stop_codon:yes gene_type:complete